MKFLWENSRLSDFPTEIFPAPRLNCIWSWWFCCWGFKCSVQKGKVFCPSPFGSRPFLRLPLPISSFLRAISLFVLKSKMRGQGISGIKWRKKRVKQQWSGPSPWPFSQLGFLGCCWCSCLFPTYYYVLPVRRFSALCPASSWDLRLCVCFAPRTHIA